MRKFIVGIFAAALMTSGLVAASESLATAAPYPGTQGTTTHARGSSAGPHHAHVFVRVTKKNPDVSGRPSGDLSFTFVRTTGKSRTYHFSRSYSGPKTYTFAGLKMGWYTVVVTYLPDSGAKWKPSNDSTTLYVKKHHRHHH